MATVRASIVRVVLQRDLLISHQEVKPSSSPFTSGKWFAETKECNRRNVLGLPRSDHRKPCHVHLGLLEHSLLGHALSGTPPLSMATMLWRSQTTSRGGLEPTASTSCQVYDGAILHPQSSWAIRRFSSSLADCSCVRDATTALPTWACLTDRMMSKSHKLF